jgi:hypothetical protein
MCGCLYRERGERREGVWCEEEREREEGGKVLLKERMGSCMGEEEDKRGDV